MVQLYLAMLEEGLAAAGWAWCSNFEVQYRSTDEVSYSCTMVT